MSRVFKYMWEIFSMVPSQEKIRKSTGIGMHVAWKLRNIQIVRTSLNGRQLYFDREKNMRVLRNSVSM